MTNPYHQSKQDQLRARELMHLLEIPFTEDRWGHWDTIRARDLYDILMDDAKLKILLSKLRNKALW